MPRKGRTVTAVAAKLGVSPQLLSAYASGKRSPKMAFYEAWKATFGEDLRALMAETNVSGLNRAESEDLKGEVGMHDAILKIILSEVAALKAVSSGLHPSVELEKMIAAAENVAKLRR